MNKTFLTIILITITLLSVSVFFSVPLAEATNIQENLKQTGGKAYYDEVGKAPTTTDPAVIVGNAIQIALSLIGILFIILILWSGFQWMTAGGNSEVITKAKQRIVNSAIGLLITLAAFGITTFILQKAFLTTGLY